jgi:hypothetical protein
MTQYVINIGAIPNDGTGDPLRTAFNETNLNFNQVFAAGPVLSNIQIANNKILTTNTNGNLVLAPNGTGVVQSNVSIVPNLANLRNLGSSTQRWATVYTQYLNATQINLAGDLTVAGNLTVQGNIIQIGNIVTDSLTIQLANTASNVSSANGAGITVGVNDNIATVLYNSAGNVWTTNIGVSSVGNISAPYFIGNGSQLTGLAATYGNANVVTLLAGFGSNNISTTGNISSNNISTTGSISSNGSVSVNSLSVNQTANSWNIAGNVMSAPSGAFWNSNPEFLDEYINSALDGYINLISRYANGNTASQIHLEHGLAQIVVDNGSEYIWAFDDTGNMTLPGNTFAVNYANGGPVTFTANTGNVTFSGEAVIGTGTSNTQSGLYLAPDPVSLANDLYLRVRGNILDEPTHIHFDTGNNQYYNLIIGDDNKYIQLANTGNIVINTNNYAGNTAQWTFDTNGSLTLPGANVDYTIATQGGYITVGNLLIGQGGALFNSNNDSWALYGNLSDPGATILIPSNADAGNGTPLYIESQQSNVEIRSGSSTWNFDTTGNLTLPGNLVIAGNTSVFGALFLVA